MGIKLRLMLSNIFQRDKPEMGFLYQCLSTPGTNGKNQEKICQSPRVQRERLFISARYVVGYFSNNCTSLSNPDRT